jgi:UDP-N-acetyl-2-amino-2-deoxyglucuronate dehydrogenase
MSKLDPVGFGILGAGMVADYHRQAIQASADLGAQLVAIGHYDRTKFDAIAARFGVPCMTQAELLANPAVQIVSVCTPSGQHAEQAVAAARAGKHVLVEKPMALRLEDADAMIAACNRAGVRLGVVLQRRAEPLFRQIHAAIRAGNLGMPTLGVVLIPYFRPQTYYDQAGWRGTWALDGGGVLMNQGIHLLDLLIWYMGDPVEVRAQAYTLQRNIEVEDTLAATLRFGTGALATIAATTTAAPGFPHRVAVFGTRGGIQIEGEAVQRWDLADPSRATIEIPQARAGSAAGAGADPGGIPASGHIAIVRDFIQAVRGTNPPLVPGEEGRRSLATALSIYQAAGLGGGTITG